MFDTQNIYDGKKNNFHHKIPLQLGGNNSPENVVIMKKSEHEILHDYIIKPQIERLRKGELRTIMLPVMRGEYFDFSSPDFQIFLREFAKCNPIYPELRQYMDKDLKQNIKNIQISALITNKQHA